MLRYTHQGRQHEAYYENEVEGRVSCIARTAKTRASKLGATRVPCSVSEASGLRRPQARGWYVFITRGFNVDSTSLTTRRWSHVNSLCDRDAAELKKLQHDMYSVQKKVFDDVQSLRHDGDMASTLGGIRLRRGIAVTHVQVVE